MTLLATKFLVPPFRLHANALARQDVREMASTWTILQGITCQAMTWPE
jgi:hypothetical protein